MRAPGAPAHDVAGAVGGMQQPNKHAGAHNQGVGTPLSGSTDGVRAAATGAADPFEAEFGSNRQVEQLPCLPLTHLFKGCKSLPTLPYITPSMSISFKKA